MSASKGSFITQGRTSYWMALVARVDTDALACKIVHKELVVRAEDALCRLDSTRKTGDDDQLRLQRTIKLGMETLCLLLTERGQPATVSDRISPCGVRRIKVIPRRVGGMAPGKDERSSR